GRVLDIGCATGNFLKVAEQNGWHAVGIDLSKWACDYLEKSGFKKHMITEQEMETITKKIQKFTELRT
ncbi:MAG: class I SAM-dependent methyltransferase, partial [Candidatus Hermodarchaeota archaeon]